MRTCGGKEITHSSCSCPCSRKLKLDSIKRSNAGISSSSRSQVGGWCSRQIDVTASDPLVTSLTCHFPHIQSWFFSWSPTEDQAEFRPQILTFRPPSIFAIE